MKLLILIHLTVTLLMTGVIWTVQILHYPLFKQVSEETFPAYEQEHMRRITIIVLPLMFAEAITALLLALQPPDQINPTPLWIALGLLIIIWSTTFFINVPHHSLLANGFDTKIHNALVLSNWIRTISWSIRAGISLWIVKRLMI